MHKLIDIFTRYLIALALAFPNLFIFYFTFTPLTIYSSYFLLNIFFNTSLTGNLITITNTSIVIIPACIAGSAYYLLTILNLTTPMKLKTRIYSLLFSYFVFLLINILRIFTVSVLFVYYPGIFFLTHLLFWYVLSTLFVVGIWFLSVKIFKIKDIPAYTDLKTIAKEIKPKKRTKKF